jgi:hypothetical protein
MATAVARLAGPPPPIASIRPNVPPAVVAILDHALQPDPALRIPSAAAFGELLERGPNAVLARPRPTAPPPTAARPVSRPRPAEPTRTQARPAAARPKRRRGGWLRVLGFLVFLLLLGVAAGLLTARLVGDNGSGGASTSGAAPELATVRDFDPFGTELPEPNENPAAVPLVYDGDADTAWNSEQYATRAFGNAKEGVGLAVTLTGRSNVSAVEIDANAGYDVEIYVADEPGDTPAAWGAVRAEQHDLPANARVELSPSAAGRYVLVWFTRLPESGRLDVAELRVR